jgi:hypothetical protein
MDNLIDDIMEDLFTVAPELRERRAEVKAAVEKMMAARPHAELDATFKSELRERLMKEFAGLRATRDTQQARNSLFGFQLSRPALAVGGLLGLVIIVTLAVRPTAAPKTSSDLALGNANTAKPVTLAQLGQVKHVAAGAFGHLNATNGSESARSFAGAGSTAAVGAAAMPVPVPPDAPVAAMDAAQISAVGAKTVSSAVSNVGVTMPVPDAKMMPIRYEPTRHEYRFTGDLTLPTTPVEVLKVDHDIDSSAVSSLLRNVNLGPIDLGRFESTKVQNLNLVEDRDFGYVINIDLVNGTANIGQNWQRWPNNPNPQPLTEADLPSDSEIIAVAQMFVQDYGLSVAGYGEPTVDRSWRRLATASAAAPAYIPDRLTVTYPMLVAGKQVYDQGGTVQGLYITVDARLKKVTDAGSITLQNYLASAYEPVTDSSAVTKAISRGGVGRWVDENAEKVVAHELDAPQEVLTTVWNYDNGQSTQLLVPALLFRVKDGAQMKDGEWYQQNVVIPLAKDFYVENPVPVMYMRGGAEPAIAPTPSVAPARP